MKKSIITLGAVALCGSLLADVSSANVVGYNTAKKTDARYEFYGCPFVTVGDSQQKTYKLYDMKLVGNMSTLTQFKNNYIQMFQPGVQKLSNAQQYYWNGMEEPGFWAYKLSDSTTGQKANAKVPEDTVIPAGTGFLCVFAATDVGLQTSGQVVKFTSGQEYAYISKPTYKDSEGKDASARYFIFSNPFPVSIYLSDLSLVSSATTLTQWKNNYVQYFQKDTQKLENARQFYWNGMEDTGFWAYKLNDSTTGQRANQPVADPDKFEIKPGEGFLCVFPQETQLKIKIPQALRDL